MSLYEKYVFFKSHMGMFISKPTYDEVAAFLIGMNFASDNKFLEDFSDWVNKRFKIQTPFFWAGLIRYIYTDEIKSIYGLEAFDVDRKESDIDFLLSLVDAYLNERLCIE